MQFILRVSENSDEGMFREQSWDEAVQAEMVGFCPL